MKKLPETDGRDYKAVSQHPPAPSLLISERDRTSVSSVVAQRSRFQRPTGKTWNSLRQAQTRLFFNAVCAPQLQSSSQRAAFIRHGFTCHVLLFQTFLLQAPNGGSLPGTCASVSSGRPERWCVGGPRSPTGSAPTRPCWAPDGSAGFSPSPLSCVAPCSPR